MERTRKMEPIAELRKKVQAPVRKYNDVAGLLVGDHVSIHLTRLFIYLNISPTVATLSMLFYGIAGSVLVYFGGVQAPVGFLCVFIYYILDCVDGEVARYHNREKLIWGFHDFMFHLWVKSAFFVCLGLYAVHFTYHSWMFLFAMSALLALLYQKFLQDLTLVLTCRQILLRDPEERQRFVDQLTGGAPPGELDNAGDLPGEHVPYSHRGVLPFLRAALTNFDLAVIFFFIASLIDLVVPSFLIWGVEANFKIALLLFYGIVFPLDYFDYLQTHIRNDRFIYESRRLLRRAHHFRLKR
jgi:hypothetical protein